MDMRDTIPQPSMLTDAVGTEARSRGGCIIRKDGNKHTGVSGTMLLMPTLYDRRASGPNNNEKDPGDA